jgi:hydroxymethylbilane synthase
MNRPLILGTRGSELALAQTRDAAARLRIAHPDLVVEERIIRTTGDRRLDVSLSAPGSLDKGLFTKELEDALLRGEVDAAVHSLKDLPTSQPEGLTLGAILEREEPDDVLISKIGGGIDALPIGSVVATSSLRRKCFLRWTRPDIQIEEIRGNVPTRIRKLVESYHILALVLARAGLRRLEAAGCALGLEHLDTTTLPFMLPAPGQGAVAIECRADDRETLEALAPLHHAPTAVCVSTERAILAGLGGGCSLPVGIRATASGDRMNLLAAWFTEGDQVPRQVKDYGPIADWEALAAAAVTSLTMR